MISVHQCHRQIDERTTYHGLIAFYRALRGKN